jgi:ABC-type glycerol-3-phosphate transport system substrate-binding protein
MENAIPLSELRFADYLTIAYQKMSEDKLDAEAALQAAEQEALKNLQTAEARRETTTIMVSTPVPTPVLASGQIAMKFGLQLFTSPIPNRDQWDQLIQNFVAQNPTIGNIDLVTQFFRPEDIQALDCYFQPYNMVPDATLTDLLPLDPFMNADPDFDQSDFLNGVLNQVQRDNQTWAYPIAIQPSVMWYNSDLFDKSNLPAPEGDWTLDAFNDAIRTLKDTSETGDPPFSPETFGNTYLLMLMAAYGSLPYDYRTSPPTIKFDDPATVEGMRQVLDLAREKLINYKELASTAGMVFGGSGTAPIFTETLSTGAWRLQNRINSDAQSSDFADPNKLTNYPTGNQFTPVAYSIAAAYIGSQSQSPEACYAWIKAIASRSDLFTAIPARRSLVDSSDVGTILGEDLAALYRALVDKLDDPNIVIFPGEIGGSGTSFGVYIEQTWLNRAFDNYVLRNGDLEQDLADAQSMISTYRECYEQIPPFDPALYSTPEESIDYYRQYVDCAVQLDASLKEQYSFYYQDEQS